MNKIKLNLGCGNRYARGFMNIDIDKNVRADKYCNATDLSFLKDNSVELCVASHIIEHLYWWETKKFFKEVYRVLDNNGKLEVGCPDILEAAKILIDNPMHIAPYKCFYGTVTDHNPYQVHKWGFTEQSLKKYLIEAGFKITEVGKGYVPYFLKITAVK